MPTKSKSLEFMNSNAELALFPRVPRCSEAQGIGSVGLTP